MKTTLISLSIASLLGLAAFATGHTFDAADFLAIAFVTGLVAWTISQYSAEPRVLTKARPTYLPINSSTAPMVPSSLRQVA